MKQIFGNGVLITLSVCAMMGFSSCEESVMDEALASELPGGGAQVSLSTRGDGDPAGNVIQESRCYFFNDAGRCVQILTTNEEDNTFSVQLAAGTYTVLSVGGEDLSRFVLPLQADASATSIITLREGQSMADLLMKQSTLTVVSGQDMNETITLERKVVNISSVEILDVPTDVTAVSVTLLPFYGSVYLNGTFPDSPTTDYTVALTKQEDGTTWKATPNQLQFPSKGNPTLIVRLTKPDGVESYSYTMSEALASNKQYSFSGTYKFAQAKLTATMTAQEWGESQNTPFDFDESNMVFSNPQPGEFQNGYYVVSVNTEARTAVLLAKSKLVYNAPASGSDASVWREALTGPMAALDKPTGITNDWRLPTIAEVAIFSKDPQIVTFNSEGLSALYFCTEDDVLKSGWTQKDGDTYTFKKSASFASYVNLRPVIDISF